MVAEPRTGGNDHGRHARPFDESLSGWERALYAFLAEKERRSGSRRTVEG